jgi:ribosomal protein S18 acetylase RimI-like enzyme
VSPGDICVRPAVAGDALGLVALARRVFAATYGLAIPAPTLQAFLHEYMTPEAFGAQIAAATPLLVALIGGDLIGYTRIGQDPPPACVGDSSAVELAQLYVEPTHQGRGVGAQLLAAAMAAIHAPIWLCAWEQNQRALRFYARHGFTVVGRTKVYVREVVFEDLVLVCDGRSPKTYDYVGRIAKGVI